MTSTQPQGIRICPSCGRPSPWDVNLCQFCGYDFRYPGGVRNEPQEMDVGLKILLYLLSLSIFVVGIIIGVIYLRKPDAESQHVGTICLVLGIISLLIIVVLIVAFFVLMAGFNSGLTWPTLPSLA